MNINSKYKWIDRKVEEIPHNTKVLVVYQSGSYQTVLMAKRFDQYFMEAYDENGDYDWCDYRPEEEEDDDALPYLPAGVYEVALNCDHYLPIPGSQTTITHWMMCPEYEEE